MYWFSAVGWFSFLAAFLGLTQPLYTVAGDFSTVVTPADTNKSMLPSGDINIPPDDSDDTGEDEDNLYIYDRTQEDPDLSRLAGLDIREEAREFALGLRRLSNDEMRVTDIQGGFDSLAYSEGRPDYQEKVSELAKEMKGKLDLYIKLLRTSKITVENLYQQHHGSHPVDYRAECCKLSAAADLRWDDMYHCAINRNMTCDLLPSVLPQNIFDAGRNITEVFQLNVKYAANLKWQYFLTTDGVHNEYPAHNSPNTDCRNLHETRRRGVLLSAAYQWRKNVVIAIDIGNSLSTTQLRIAKAAAKHIIFTLSDIDWVGVVAVSSDIKFARGDGCLLDRLMPLNYETKLYLSSFIDGLDKESTTVNHSLAFSAAFSMIKTLAVDNTTDVLIAYISRGLLSSLIEPKDVLSVIGYEYLHTPHRVIINTYAVVDDTKPVMYERTFLQDVAGQNYSKYQVDRYSFMPSRRGRMASLNSTQNMDVVIGDPFLPFNWTVVNRPIVTLPRKDEVGKGVVVGISWPCVHDGLLFGVIGFDVHMTDITEHVTYHTHDSSLAFITDKRGFAVVHPSIDRPASVNIQPLYTNVAYFENIAGFDNVQRLMLRELSGKATLVVRNAHNTSLASSTEAIGSSSSSGDSSSTFQSAATDLHVTYYFQHVVIEQNNETVYIVVIKVIDELANRSRVLRTSSGPGSSQQLIYHRIDLLPTENNCVHFRQLATMDGSALYLSTAAFIHPFEHVSNDETKRMVQSYLAFLSDNTNLISNPGILERVRKDVWATATVNNVWLKHIAASDLSAYIIRRYLATPSGVFRMYPGTLLNNEYDATKRHWYMRALAYPGKVTLTAPYLDVGGAGYIVTISHTIYEGKSTSLHGPKDRVVAVVGMDVTLKFFHKLLIDQIPVCQLHSIRCFIMDDRGYLIAHRGLIDPTEKGPLEEKHITHREPLVANDILNHRGFVHKKVCNSFVDRTMQRFYQFNTSLDGVITNLVHGEHCARYQITPIIGTNAFLGVVNQSCDIRAFCPCSMVDRLCLNCHRVEQTECECPCECPLLADFCSDELDVSRHSCPRSPEELDLDVFSKDSSLDVPRCIQSNCEQRQTKDTCVGVMGCEWCELERDNDAVLHHSQPFCASQRVCFGGVLGARSPYNDHLTAQDLVSVHEEPALLSKSMPVGPVAGGIMGCFVLLALGVYCYRHHVHGRSHHCTGSLPGEAQLRDSNNDFEDLDDGNNGHADIMMATFDNKGVNPAVMNPYWMNTSYRRPTNTPASDLGYSTMTPHGDDTSEQASTTCVDSSVIGVVGRDRYRPPLIPVAASATILPPPRSHCRRPLLADIDDPSDIMESPLPQTVLPSMSPVRTMLLPNQFVADVEVHMVDVH